ncbi:serine/threonine-protein kinase [Nonomuraea sediminis]|uniref:serine/threonine-protein kinase n=1 Tax=Nonomuraea sediminis TaxID=2835864 RepID=UPI001BDC5185|nr:serine/threonine-protein kinase [Nonomuraea sediminis]
MQVPGYTEVRELGHGGTGRVMLAVRDSDGLPVAIKHISERLLQDEDFVERFRAEALVIKELDSPHTARLLEYVEGDGDAVIVMELVDGVTLRRLLEHEGGTGPEAALAVLKGALLALAEAHRHGVVHRDFKPENVIVSQDGDSKLVDFGVAVHSGESVPLVGTPSYMAPEQWEEAPASPATDVYAASVVFFECLTGHRPFLGDNIAALAYQHQNVPPPIENVAGPIRALVEHGLAKDPADRPVSAEAFLAELEATAAAAYGSDWEERGRAGLGALTLPFTALLPLALSAAEGSTSLFSSTLSPPGKLLVTGGLVVATAVAVISAFSVWNSGPEEKNVSAFPPPTRTAQASPPFETTTAEPATPEPSLTPPTITEPATAGPVFTPGPSITKAPEPSRTQEPQPTRTREPTRTQQPTPTRTREPTRQPTRTQEPTRPPTQQPTRTQQPPTSSPPDPGTATRPKPLLSVSVKVSLDVPVLSGKGDGLLDADVGLGVGTGLLGFVVVPGSVLLGRRFAVRRTRHERDTEMT